MQRRRACSRRRRWRRRDGRCRRRPAKWGGRGVSRGFGRGSTNHCLLIGGRCALCLRVAHFRLMDTDHCLVIGGRCTLCLLVAHFRLMDTDHSLLIGGRCTLCLLVAHFRLMDDGLTWNFLVACDWMPVSGCGLLVAGCWLRALLVAPSPPPSPPPHRRHLGGGRAVATSTILDFTAQWAASNPLRHDGGTVAAVSPFTERRLRAGGGVGGGGGGGGGVGLLPRDGAATALSSRRSRAPPLPPPPPPPPLPPPHRRRPAGGEAVATPAIFFLTALWTTSTYDAAPDPMQAVLNGRRHGRLSETFVSPPAGRRLYGVGGGVWRWPVGAWRSQRQWRPPRWRRWR